MVLTFQSISAKAKFYVLNHLGLVVLSMVRTNRAFYLKILSGKPITFLLYASIFYNIDGIIIGLASIAIYTPDYSLNELT